MTPLWKRTDSPTGPKVESVQLDIFGAIQAHVQWKQRLLDYIHNRSSEKLDPDHVCSDRHCSLGQWIYHHGIPRFGDHPRFQELKDLHADFHYHAAEVIRCADRGEHHVALEQLNRGDYSRASNRIKAMLARLSLEVDFG